MAEVPPGMPAKWEDILAMFHDGTTKLPDRNAVAGTGSKPWITTKVDGKWFTNDPAKQAEKWGLSCWHAFSFPYLSSQLMYGFGYDWEAFGNDSGALAEFTGAPITIFPSVTAGKNKDANPAHSAHAATVLNNMDDWTDGWVTQFNTWAEKVGSGEEQLKGETAEIFEATLLAVKRALQETYSYYMGGEVQKQLEGVSAQVKSTVEKLSENYWAWRNTMEVVDASKSKFIPDPGSIAMAFPHLRAAFFQALAGELPTSDTTVEANKLDWGAIEATAKASWLAGVDQYLDKPSADTMINLATAYDTAAMKVSDANAIVKPTFTISLTADEQKEFYGSTGTGEGGSGGADEFLNKFKEMFSGGAGGKDGGTGPDGGSGGSILPNTSNFTATPPPITGPNGGTGGTNLPKDGLNLTPPPITGPNGGSGGSILTVPPGSRVDPRTGAVTDSRGKAVLGPDGKPLIVPPGSTIGSGGRIVPPTTSGSKPPTLPSGSTSGDALRGFRVDAEGNIVVPKGTTVDAKGNLIGADGKPLTNAYGGKLTVPPGSRINADGTISDPQGKHITESSDKLKAQTPTSLGILPNGQRSPLTWSGDLFGNTKGANDLNTNLRSSGDLFSSSKGGGEMLRRVDSNGNKVFEPNGATSGISNRARLAMGLPAAPTAPTQGGLVTQSGNVLGRAGAPGAAGSGMPFMPPMGMGGGAPGGGSGSGNDRQRNVWLSEDEEVWGTEPEAGTGVIGR
ncbi:hypothetical protein ACIQ9M_03680 [Streptomyces californicus]|uniref:hypothetical protein n=1 Tax=Streptomyces californicus TaxID=67351 RepID=UPI0005BC58E6